MTADVLVIGGGPAGSAAALRLARAGVRACLVERSSDPHDKVCGEFVSGEAAADLRDLGLDPLGLGAIPIGHTAFADRRGRVSETVLPFPAYSLTRRVLDWALLDAAAQAGSDVRLGFGVSRLVRDGTGWSAIGSRGERASGRSVFVATGKHDLRDRPRPDGAHPGLVGLKMHYATGRALPAHVALAPFRAGYAGLQPIGAGRFNLCLAVSAERVKAAGGPMALVGMLAREQPLIGAWLDGAEPLFDRMLAIGRVPYGFVRRSSDGPFHLGDQAAVIPSLTGDGIAIALASAREAADGFLAGEDGPAFQRRFARLAAPPVRRATILSRLIIAPALQVPVAALATVPAVVRGLALATRIATV